MSMSIEEAREFAARVCAECDALYGNPQQQHTLALHERAYQLRKAERAKQQQETNRRVAKHQAKLAARQADTKQLVAQRGEEWAKWFGACFDNCSDQIVDDFKNIVEDDKKATTAFGSLFKYIIDTIAQVQKTQNKFNDDTFAKIGERLKDLKDRAAVADEERGKLQAALGGKQQQLDELQAANALLLDRITRLEAARQADAINDAEITERIIQLETTNSLEARFTKLANEIKRGSELPQSELLPRIEGLQGQFDDLKKIANQPGPQGPPGKLSKVKDYIVDAVHYESDVVTHAGALWQARSDTVHAPPHPDWVCLARAGRDGLTPTIRGTYDTRETYERLDIVALDGAAFIARCDNPGICPGDDWQLLSRQGRPGRRGETGERGVRGEKGERGEPGVAVVSWQLDRERYRVSPLMNNGTVGPMLELRGLFEQFLSETS